DLLSIDFGAILGGFHGDAARSDEIGKVAPAVAGLNQATEQAVWVGIGAARLDGRISDISAAIEGSLKVGGAKGEGYGIVRELTGHGIGHAMHQPPEIPNHGRPGRGPLITPGMCLALEPMATLGSGATTVLDDEWTIVSDDGSYGAHWENTITVTKRGLWVLTELDGGEARLKALNLPYGPLAD
ncbi:MAG: M24 family metallopeptidase, partial [Propionibacteriaceae bacterium]|nr:M24 family metallopeptidase [Propionibacteriaceae bacterium]